MPLIRCPVCETRFDQLKTTVMPFCSIRCQKIDLGRWLGEQYSVTVDRLEDDEESEEAEGFGSRRARNQDDEDE